MPETPWLDPTPDTGLMGHTLDLGRAELRPLMERYGTLRKRDAMTGLLRAMLRGLAKQRNLWQRG